MDNVENKSQFYRFKMNIGNTLVQQENTLNKRKMGRPSLEELKNCPERTSKSISSIVRIHLHHFFL